MLHRLTIQIAFTIIAACLAAECTAQEKILPAELHPFVLPGYDLLDFKEGDLNGDKKNDALLILKQKGEDTIDSEPARPMLLLIRKPAGKLSLQKRNDSLVMCYRCGGVFGDPYEEINITNTGFKISFYGGSNWRWAYNFSFSYFSKKDDWILVKESNLYYNSAYPEKTTKDYTIGTDELGEIRFEACKSRPPYIESKWKVASPKAFFYDQPKFNSKPRKGYLVQGDIITGTRMLKNFVEASYQNKNGDFTYGFILKQHLQPL